MPAAPERPAQRRRASGPAPRVSVVVPTRNRARLLPRALHSVRAQTFADLEIVVVDAHSGDDTPAVLTAFGDDRLRTVALPRHGGQSAALNTGIARARADYLAFLDDDDEWLPDKLARQVARLDAAPAAVGLVYGWHDRVDRDGGRRSGPRPTLRGDILEDVLAHDTPVPPSSWLVRRAAVDDVGGFDPALRVAKDADFAVRLAVRGWHVDLEPRVVFLKHAHDAAQLTDPTPANLAARADYARRHLARFAGELAVRPAAHAVCHLTVALHELPLGGLSAALPALAVAFRLAPLTALRRIRRHHPLRRRLAAACLPRARRYRPPPGQPSGPSGP